MPPDTAHAIDFDTSKASSPDLWLAALRELLVALKWRGEERHISEALPLTQGSVDCDQFREILANLGFPSLHRRGSPKMLDARWLPALYLDRQGKPHLLVDETDQDEAPDAEHALLLFRRPATKAPISRLTS